MLLPSPFHDYKHGHIPAHTICVNSPGECCWEHISSLTQVMHINRGSKRMVHGYDVGMWVQGWLSLLLYMVPVSMKSEEETNIFVLSIRCEDCLVAQCDLSKSQTLHGII